MNWTDWVIIGIIALSGLLSLKRGFMREAMSLISWIVAFILARLFSGVLSTHLVPFLPDPAAAMMAAFAILFVATLLVCSLIQMLIIALVRATGLSATDRLLGVGFGVVRGGLVVVVIVALLRMTPVATNEWWQSSNLIPHFVLLEGWTKDMAKQLGMAIWDVSSSG
ncbi:MAG TPA: CvpA family protein [Marinobacterium sp.]|nr:CvpA family protein [Marinobacterium sp.]